MSRRHRKSSHIAIFYPISIPVQNCYAKLVHDTELYQGAGKRPRQCCPKGLKHGRQSLEGPKGPRVAQTRESEGPKGPRTSKAQSSFRRLPVLLYVFLNSAQNRDFRGSIWIL